jgi:hypothetical protein
MNTLLMQLRPVENTSEFRSVRKLWSRCPMSRCQKQVRRLPDVRAAKYKSVHSVCGLRRVVREPLMSREICERTQSARVKLTCARVKQLRLYSRLVWGASKSSYTILRSRGSWGGWVGGVWGVCVGGGGGGGVGSPPPPPPPGRAGGGGGAGRPPLRSPLRPPPP